MPDLFLEIARLREAQEPAALATVIGARGSTPAKVPARMLVYADGRTLGTVGGGCIEAEVRRAAQDAMETGRVRILEWRLHGAEAERTGVACGGIVTIMVESLAEPVVVIVGAGHVGQACAKLAQDVGFRVTVVDDRPDFANTERFPGADRLIVAGLDELAGSVPIGPEGRLLIMTRGHSEDYRVLRWALGTPARWIGVLGSRSKRIQFMADLERDGVSPADRERVRMPVGLDIGASTVPEIAVSIVAELIATRRAGDPARG
jgi:xanthine dehydrogenase accessory factor